MVSLRDAVSKQCPDVDPALIEHHFNSLPATYFERYAVADVARHLRLLTRLSSSVVEVEVRPLTAQTFDVTVVGVNHSGTLACITAAFATLGFNLDDVQVSPYLSSDEGTEGDFRKRFFVIVLRVSGSLRGLPPGEFSEGLRARLAQAFSYLADGNLQAAQTIAGETRTMAPGGFSSGQHRLASEVTAPGYEGLLLGGDFKLLRKVATGGTCHVYEGKQLSLDRTVAVKLFQQEHGGDPDLLARFNQEAMVLARFSCPQIVQILAAGVAPGDERGMLGWMVMEYMEGGDVARFLRLHGPPQPEIGVRWLLEALEGLRYAHRHGVLHRDLKPHNLLLTDDGAVKVSDFGLLKHFRQPPAGLTPRSTIMGTPHYMSPEQANGETLDERSDIFSLGTCFFHILSGYLPFDKPSPAAVLVQIAQEEAPRLSEMAPQLPVALSVVLARMMARHQEERYQDVKIIMEDLASYLRRGLLGCAGLRAMQGGQGWVPTEQQTEAYQRPERNEGRDAS